MSDIILRLATQQDVQAMVDITNHYIQSSTCIMKEKDETDEERSSMLSGNGNGYPTFVAILSGEIVGWGGLAPHSERSVYRFTVNDAIYVRKDMTGHGIGSAILEKLIVVAKELGYHSMIAVIASDQERSILLHNKFGFTKVAHLYQVGFKFGRWTDVVQMQLML